MNVSALLWLPVPGGPAVAVGTTGVLIAAAVAGAGMPVDLAAGAVGIAMAVVAPS